MENPVLWRRLRRLAAKPRFEVVQANPETGDIRARKALIQKGGLVIGSLVELQQQHPFHGQVELLREQLWRAE